MDIALKQRLVGASVLVALGVIFIPMLLDGPGVGGAPDTRRIPEPPDRRFETRLLPVDPSQNGRESSAPEPGEPVAVTSVPVSRVSPVVTDPIPDPTPPDSEPAPDPVSTPSPQGEAPQAPPAAEAGEWVIQLGSFGNAANAGRLVERLQASGYRGYQEKIAVGDRTLYRVRVGFWASKDQAATAGTLLGRTMGDVDVSVRRLEDAPRPAAVAEGWMVQVGSFSSQDNALTLRDQLRASGFAALVEAVSGGGGTSFRVRVGPEIDRGRAEAMRSRLRDEMGLNGIVVTHP